MNASRAPALQGLLDEGAQSGIFPAARACIIVEGHKAFEGGAGDARPDSLFDLASLTKVICTTACFISLWSEGLLTPDTPLQRFFPGAPAAEAGASLADLLYHRSGLPAWRPFFQAALERWPELLTPTCPPRVRVEARRFLVAACAMEPIETPRGREARYSDLGFILLGEALAIASHASLEELYQSRVARPLGLGAAFRPLTVDLPSDRILATGTLRPRSPAPGQLHTWGHLKSEPAITGQVDDDNAWVMNGVAGHTGLFGTAEDVARFGQAVLEELDGKSRVAPRTLWEHAVTRDAETPESTRALGFDTPSLGSSSAGRYFGKAPPGAFGHLGFTGVSLWVDRVRRMVVALCTNRTMTGRADQRIQSFRPRFHDLAVEALSRG